MDWLNYHHLLYFWMVAKEGSITRASEMLHLAQPTLSSQIKKLEKSMGADLFHRVGRTMVLTETGQMVYRYADEIFTLGRELVDTIGGMPGKDSLRLTVGIPDVLPKLVIYRLLKPALEMDDKVQLVCYEGKLHDLLADLALHRLDIVLADTPIAPSLNIRAFNHLLGESGTTVLGTNDLVQKFKKNFPASLDSAPMLLPTQNTSLRRALEQWFDNESIRPTVLHEFEDSALLKVFGQQGEGLFPAPTAIEDEICRQYGVKVLGRLEAVRQRFYAISVQRRLKHPAVIEISSAAREKLFADRTAKQ